MPPAIPERPQDLRTVDDREFARVPQQRRPPDGPPDSSPEQRSAIDEARRREAEHRNTAAAELFEAEDFAGAAEMFEAALTSSTRILGERHPDTLRVAGNLGVALVMAGDHKGGRKGRAQTARGIRLIDAVIDMRSEVLGPHHPDTLNALQALVEAQRIAGHADAALEVAKKVVMARNQALGPVHPDTLTSRMGLGVALAGTGDTMHAQRIVASTLTAAEEALGGNHEHLEALVEWGVSARLLRQEV